MNEKKIDTNAKQVMQEALAKYLQDKNSVKEFYPCSQEMSAWLKEKETV